jgi:DNA helicase HerA-like ATPase
MTEAFVADPTYVGQVSLVRGGVVQVRLRDVPTTLVMVEGTAHRIGQIGAYVRIPLGYTQLYGVCTQVGADVVRADDDSVDGVLELDSELFLTGYRWMTVVLFGESVEGRFDRGVGQFPTVGDPVHLVTAGDLDVIYRDGGATEDSIVIGRIAGSDSIAAELRVSSLVSRHACIVGSTGADKSNLVAVLLRALAGGEFSSARVLVIDPHGEYASALPASKTHQISVGASGAGEMLRVPYWALRFDELARVAFGPLSDANSEYIRERVRAMKVEAAQHLASPPAEQAITADSPIPFSIRRLWFELKDIEERTFEDRGGETPCGRTVAGDAETLEAPEYPTASLGSAAPFLNPARKGLGRQLDFLRSRLHDGRFTFLFDNTDGYHPDQDGTTALDLDALLANWLGNGKVLTVLDVSAVPAEVIGIVVGSLLSLVYEALFWGMNLPVGGKQQPLLLVVDEAHRFLPAAGESAASRACSRIAKEGRKYGVGLAVVTQRPSDLDPAILSQCGTMIALRITNGTDRGVVAASVPDDLGGLTSLLPSLRTGEGLVLGEALQVPSRVRIDRAPDRPVGDDPKLPDAWRGNPPDPAGYTMALAGWRAQATATGQQDGDDQ